MDTFEATRARELPFSGIRKIYERAGELEADGHDVIHLEMGRPDFDTPHAMKEAATLALERGDVHYASNYGTLALREAIAAKLERDNHLVYDPKGEILVTIGVAEALFLTFASFVDVGDEVLVPTPSWPNYRNLAKFCGAHIVPYHLRRENAFRPDFDELRASLSSRTKLVIVNSPHNPTGIVWTTDDFNELASLAAHGEWLLCSDEIYEKLTYGGAVHISPASHSVLRDRTIIVNGFSKAYSMTGWRLGYATAPDHLINTMVRVHQNVVTCVPSFVQTAASIAWSQVADECEVMRQEFQERRDLVVREMEKIGGVECIEPQGAFYVYPYVRGLGMDGDQVAHSLLEEAHVAVVPGSVFGSEQGNYLRLSFTESKPRLTSALDRMRVWVSRL
jgi:aminotransferase